MSSGSPLSTNVLCPDVIGRDSWDWDVSWVDAKKKNKNFIHKMGVLAVLRKSDYAWVKTECPRGRSGCCYCCCSSSCTGGDDGDGGVAVLLLLLMLVLTLLLLILGAFCWVVLVFVLPDCRVVGAEYLVF